MTKGVKPLKINTQKRIFRGLIVSALLCALIVATLSPAAFAASTSVCYAEINVSVLNVRTGPGLSYDVAYSATTGDIINLTGDTATADGYTWYKVSGGDEYWIADTGGWTLVNSSAYEDTICAYGVYGDLAWSHTCVSSDPDWSYYLEVQNDGYYIRCDCGWWYYRLVGQACDDNGQIIAYFIGLDTDNDERVDLKPGQTKELPNRANSDLRPYQILEFMDSLDKDTPTVTITFATSDNDLIAEYTFIWWVDVYVESYGVRMVGMDGTEIIHPVDYDFMLYDRFAEFYLGDEGARYKHGDLLMQTLEGDYVFRHVQYTFTLAPVGEGDIPILEWITYITRSISEIFSELFNNFFGLTFIFTDENSPFKFLIGG